MNRLLESATGLTLLHPAWLLVALAVPALWWVRRRRPSPSLAFAAAPLLDPPLPRSARSRLLLLPTALEIAGLLLGTVALARPVARSPLPLRTEGIDILLCLDLSSSMTAADLDRGRTRLEVARAAAAAFVRGRPGDRIGLLGFSRYPDLRCPPTLDHGALERILDATATVDADGPEDATGIGGAVARAGEILSASASASRVVILLTDGGEDVAGPGSPGEIAPLHAAQLCGELGVRVHVVAAGNDGPRTGGGEVRTMAERTGGRYFEARDAGALAGVYASIDAMERAEFDRPRFESVDRFSPFLLAALALLLLGRLLGVTVLGVLP